MYKTSIFSLFIMMLALGCITVFADNTPVTNTLTNQHNMIMSARIPEPCVDLGNVCKAAGFVKQGQSSGKDIWMNCIQIIMQGQSVPNVNAKPEQIQSCKNDLAHLPCVPILQACHNAGFVGNGPGKLPAFDCLFPIAQGQQIAGVNPDPKDLEVCKSFMADLIRNNPCLRVMLACKAAGYSPDSVNGEMFARNCLVPITNGEQVLGVTVDSATAAACKAQMAPKKSAGT